MIHPAHFIILLRSPGLSLVSPPISAWTGGGVFAFLHCLIQPKNRF